MKDYKTARDDAARPYVYADDEGMAAIFEAGVRWACQAVTSGRFDLTGTPARDLIEAARTAFYRLQPLPLDLFAAVKAYEAAGRPCPCACHNGDDHCDDCCVVQLCDDCRFYAGSDL